MAGSGDGSAAPSACPSDLECKLAFKPGFDSRFTLGATLGCSALVGLLSVALAFSAPAILISNHDLPRAPGKWGECEGYWPPPAVCLPLGTNSHQGVTAEEMACPQAHVNMQWDARSEFLAKLADVESVAKNASADFISKQLLAQCGLNEEPFIHMMSFRGIAMSRMEDGVFLGNREFESHQHTGSRICWPDGFADHYVGRFGVKPTQEFRTFIQEFDLNAFRLAASNAVACRKKADREH
mmetsp:Transcript_88266/g.175408  ORF Transcript_88266/g.175408 Transcript_88266/m.175408 type:complete len:240 (+) Transcript_88266:173-892(+)|eukprot:CAMPEP_0172671048 /NCGR_PEP_ID=MMETSP1074-20121228/10664_1 /TAXON_ID=2916 /ORGANISM="Ceratium fusus, Strain PA161109" /LENGTH=239 /DNA_ID=CAMNT_0013488035 /DNA_START=125 /DNA_END=844 /DNA_ORIENTATION=-